MLLYCKGMQNSESSVFYYLRVSPQHVCMKECKKTWETQFNQTHLVSFQFHIYKKHQNKYVQEETHISLNSPEGLQACLACEKTLPSGVVLTTPAIQLHSCPFFFMPTAEFLVNHQGK